MQQTVKEECERIFTGFQGDAKRYHIGYNIKQRKTNLETLQNNAFAEKNELNLL